MNGKKAGGWPKTMMEEEMTVEIPDMWNTEANILTSGDYEVTLQPCIQKIYLDLPKPSIEDQTSDADRLLRALGRGRYRICLCALLPEIMEKNGYKVTAVLNGNTVIGVESGDTTKCCYGGRGYWYYDYRGHTH